MRSEFHVLTADEFTAERFPNPPYVIDPIFVSGGIHLIFGREGAGKTQLMLTIARDVVNGSKLFGKYECERGRVCYLGVDMPLQMLQKRIGRMIGEVGASEDFLIAAKDTPIDITQTRTSADWVESIREFDPNILFIDTLHKIHRLDENSSQTVAQIYGHLKRVFGGEVAIALVHHEGKGHPDPRVDRDESDRQRGSSAWLADSDLGMRVKGFQNPISGGNVTVSFPRVRFCPEQEPLTLEMRDESLLLEPKMDEQATDLVTRYLSLRPDAERIDIANFLAEEHDYSKSQAYKAINAVLDSD